MGYALALRSPGFWGPIDGYLGVDSRAERILGIAFTRQGETPGLGGRIVEAWFREQFRGKPIVDDGQPVLDFVFRTPETSRERHRGTSVATTV